MLHFPENFNKDAINKARDDKQEKLLSLARKNIYEAFQLNYEKDIFTTTYKLPEKLNRDKKIILFNELLERFDVVTLTINVFDIGNKTDNVVSTLDVHKGLNELNGLESTIKEPRVATITELTLHH